MSGVLRYLWAAPCTLVGCVAAAPMLLCGAQVRGVRGVIEISGGAFAQWLAFDAITLGHVVLARTRVRCGAGDAMSGCMCGSASAGGLRSLRRTCWLGRGSGCVGAARIGTTRSRSRRSELAVA